MGTHPTKQQIQWKKILLAVVGGIFGIIAVIIVGIFLWMQTWKKYEFPDKQGSIKYPPFWVLEPSRLDNSGMGSFGEITDGTNTIGHGLQISFVRYYPTWNRTAQQDAQQRANQVISYHGGRLVNYNFTIEGEPIYSAEENFSKEILDQRVEFSHNGYVYEFQFISSHKGLQEKLARKIFSLMLRNIHFNPRALSTTQKSPSFSN